MSLTSACDSFSSDDAASQDQKDPCSTLDETASTGDPCSSSCGSGRANVWRSLTCDESGTLRVATVTIVERTGAGSVASDAGLSQSYCPDALAGWGGPDACIGEWACARASTKECCVEIASCGAYDFLRLEVCSDGCTNVAPDPDLSTATDCSSAREGAAVAGQPCTGSFICAGEQDISETPISAQAEDIFWCAGGTVQVATFINGGAV